jgi:peptidyl-prolyl cis-trans isomerase D
MLRNFRSVFKGKQGFTGGMMVVIALSMLIYLVPGGGGAIEAPDSVVARVYGRELLYRDLAESMRNLERGMGRQADREAMMPYLQAQALRQIVNQKLMEELAERHGVLVTDAEVFTQLNDELRRSPVFVAENGQLRPKADIEAVLRDNGWTLAQVERDARTQVLFRKLRVQASAVVPTDEALLRAEDRVRNEKVAFEQVQIAPDPTQVQDPGDAKLDGFLQAGGARFQVGPRRVVQYVALDSAFFGESLKVGEEDLRKAFEARKAQAMELKASHILFKATGDAQVQAALKQAADLRAKLVAGLDFNKAAEEQSQDPSAKGNRGDLGWFKGGAMAKPFEDGAKALKIGEISQPVRTPFGVHLIKLEGRREKTFDDLKDSLRDELGRERFSLRAKERLEQLRKRTGDRGDIDGAGKNLGLKVQTSQPLRNDMSGILEGVPASGMIISDIFRLKVGDVSKVLQAADRFVVFRVIEEKPSAVPPLKEIRPMVLEAWKLEESRKATFEKAKASLASGGLKALGEAKTQEAATIKSLGELGQHPAIRKALLETAEGATTPLIWAPDGRLWAATITARTPAPPLTFGTRRSLIQELQREGSEKAITAELMDLDTKGRARAGFSSLWGRLGGIWMNPKLAEAKFEGMGEE